MSVNVSLLEKCAVLKSKLVIDANHVDPKPFYVVILATEHLERDGPRPIGSFLVLLGTFLVSDVTERPALQLLSSARRSHGTAQLRLKTQGPV